MAFIQQRVKPGLYRDSVALMRLSAALLARPGITQASLMMATPANRQALAQGGLPLPAEAELRPDDLLLTVAGDDLAAVGQALDWAELELGRPRAVPPAAAPDAAWRPQSLQEGARPAPAQLALISVPGEYAAAEALKALKLGLHVFLFSSGVALDDEVRLKQFAAQRGLLLMGPDCGTALIDGQPLGFANAVRRGGIGLVAASGSGLQEVMCLLDQGGGGVSQAIGAGGRDLHERVGGLTMLAGIERLARDPETRVIVLLSKPAPPAVAEPVLAAARRAGRPVVAALLGAGPQPLPGAGVQQAGTLEDAARLALAAEGLALPAVDLPPPWPPVPPRRWVRGLFVGGTLCAEARQVLAERLGPVAAPEGAEACPDGHFCQDLGAAALTQGRPHPMIDGRLRAERIARAAADPATAVVLFDVVLGYGASPEPLAPLLPVLAAAPPGVRFVAHVCGTEADPQRLSAQVAGLQQAGVTVLPTNAAAARLAARWAGLEGHHD
jgi:succinyl-CoA synthetase alpha subunit